MTAYTEEKKTKRPLSQEQANALEGVHTHKMSQEQANAKEGIAHSGKSFDFAGAIRDMHDELQLLAARVERGADEDTPLTNQERQSLLSLKDKLKNYAPLFVASAQGKPIKHGAPVERINHNRDAVKESGFFSKVAGVCLAIPSALFLLPMFAFGVIAGGFDGLVESDRVLSPRNRHEQNVAHYFGQIAKSMGFGNEKMDVDAIIKQNEKAFTSAFAYGVGTLGYAVTL